MVYGWAKLCLMYFISSHGIPETVLPCSPAFNACRELQAVPKAVSRAHPCSPFPGSSSSLAPRAEAVWALPGCLRAAGSGLPRELYRRKVDRSGRRPRMRAREADRSTVQAGNYANYPSSHPKWLFWSIKPNHFILVLNPLVLQVKMKVVEHIVSIISTYCDCR